MGASRIPPDLHSMAARFITSLWRFNRELGQQLEPLMEERHGIDARTYFLLRTIDSGVAYPKSVSEHLKIPPSLTSRYLDGLLKQNLVERAFDERDSRRVKLALTTTGREVMTAADRTLNDLIGERLGRLQPEKLHGLLDALDALAGDTENA